MRSRSRTPVVLGLVLSGHLLLSGCSGLLPGEAVCGGGEYPIAQIGGPGSACAPDDEEPPSGYVRYPEGKVPDKVDDEWSKYWQDHWLDENGNEIPAG